MKRVIFLGVALLLSSQSNAAVLYTQAPDPAGGIIGSAWYPPDGLDGDNYAYDSFVLPAGGAITEIHWRGGYTNFLSGAGESPVFDFTISIYPSIAAGIQPDITAQPVVQYSTGNNAGETLAGTVGGIPMYDYRFTLPSAFQAVAGTKYWLQIEASQGLTPTYYWPPDWGFSGGTGGDGSHFHSITGGTAGGGTLYQMRARDLAFSLLGADAPTGTIAASVSPANAGTIAGTGTYPIGSVATLQATPSAGFGFVNWTENGAVVSTSANYSFVVSAARTLVANFTTAYTVTTSPLPAFGGSTTGDGLYNNGALATVVATPNAGFHFVNWTEFGTPVSTSATYQFAASADRVLDANFALGSTSAIFDFDSAPLHTSLPIDLTVNGITAHFSATGQGFSIQEAGALGFTPVNFAGYCIYPNSVFAADLLVSFSRPLTDFGILYAPEEYGCDSSARMRVTAYKDGVLVGTNTATANPPGTWPTGTLNFSSAQRFNSVVVHYDAPPPTGGDWGPIFMADNVFVTAVPGLRGDLNCDGVVNNQDIDGFILALFNPSAYVAQYPACDMLNGDFSGDGLVNNQDIDGFVMALFGV